MNDKLFIIGEKLKSMTFFAIFLVLIHFLLDSTDGELP
jgi:hypothetical protein